MPRDRGKENKNFPPGWRWKNGAIYYQVPQSVRHFWDGKQLFRLGKTEAEAYKTWADRLVMPDKIGTITKLLDRYLVEIVPTKKPKTRTEYTRYAPKIRKAFGHFPLTAIRPKHVYQYFDARNAKGSARKEIAMLSSMLTKAVQWGYIDRHPFKGEIRLEAPKPRTRYVEDWEIIECLALEPAAANQKKWAFNSLKAYIELKLLTGLRRSDLLRINMKDITPDGLRITVGKTGKPVIYEITPTLQKAIDKAKAARPVDISPFLFCNKYGECYVKEETGRADGWDSVWQRFMKRLLKHSQVEEKFTEHDLRAKVGSDAESLERARQLLAHADSKITQRVYRRKPEKVRPTK